MAVQRRWTDLVAIGPLLVVGSVHPVRRSTTAFDVDLHSSRFR